MSAFDRLTELANQRASFMERLQQIDDEASELLTAMDTELSAVRKSWAHLLPQDHPIPGTRI